MPLLPMILFAASLSLAPGPVNLIVLSTALQHGAASALRFVSGATLGFTVLLVLTGLGLSATAQLSAAYLHLSSLAGAMVILYFGQALLRADGRIETAAAPIPGFFQGALLQWLNPKAWVACLGGVALFNLQGDIAGLLRFALLYCVICFLGVGCWAVLGRQLGHWLSNPGRRRWFNRALGLTLILLALSMVAPALRALLLR